MATRPWVISVLSTDYDLHEYRSAVIDLLQSKDVIVSAFELPDFPVETDIHSHDSCITALDRSDIALLVIDKRYGGIYIGDSTSTQSITKEEYIAVAKSGKPCFVFVSRQAWDERHSYKVNLKAWMTTHPYSPEQKQAGLPETEFKAQYNCTYVESIGTIEFIEFIQGAYKRFSRSNWIDQYDSIPNLLMRIEGKLKGHTRYLLESLVREQKKRIESRHTSTGLSLSLGDVFSRGYYLEPSFEQESGDLQDGESLDIMIRNTLSNNYSVLVYGEAGYGKTTILAKSYLSHVDEFLKQDSYHIPFYLWLKKKNCDYHFDFLSYINESFADDLCRDVYPFMELRDVQPYFYFDGFDEIAEKMTPDEVDKFSQADMFSHPVLLTCRHQYANRYINNSNFSDKFGIRVRINTWDETMAIAYIDNFCRINRKSSEFAATIHQLLADNHAMHDILNSPLLITMMLWIIERNRMQIPETIHTRVELFRACVTELAKRELTRLRQSEAYTSELIMVWSYAAWEVYYNKLNDKESKLSTLIPKLKTLLPAIELDYSASHFEVLFDCFEDKIFGTFHEQFLEYFVANALYFACKSREYPYPEFLSYVIRPEINRYFRAIWHECTVEDQKQIVANLHEQYLSNLGDDSFDAISKRVHAIYHIGRFDTPERKSLIDRAFNSENHISVRLSLFFGAIKMGRLDDEQLFYDLLTTDSDCNEANRGYHLAYYSDAIMTKCLPYKDDTDKKWAGTLRAFLRHFKSVELEHYFLRRIDLATMMQLIKARGTVAPLTKDIVDELGRLVYASRYSSTYPEFQDKIVAAYIALKELFEAMSVPITSP